MLPKKLLTFTAVAGMLATVSSCCHCPEPSTTTVVTTPPGDVRVIETPTTVRTYNNKR